MLRDPVHFFDALGRSVLSNEHLDTENDRLRKENDNLKRRLRSALTRLKQSRDDPEEESAN